MGGIFFLASAVGVLLVIAWLVQQERKGKPGFSGLFAMKEGTPEPKRKKRKYRRHWLDVSSDE